MSLIILATLAMYHQVWSKMDPPESLRISPETTFVTEPLADDGLPDYAAALFAEAQRGSPNEENGAILFWEAMGPAMIEEHQRELFFREIGCPIPNEEGVLEPVRSNGLKDQVGRWIANANGIEHAETIEPATNRFLKLCLSRPWRQNDGSPMQGWVSGNKGQLDIIVQAVNKPRFYSPSPSLLEATPPSLYDVLLPTAQTSRGAFESLAARIASQVSTQRFNDCLEDTNAILAYGRRLESSVILVEQLIGLVARRHACRAVQMCAQSSARKQHVEALKSVLVEAGEYDGKLEQALWCETLFVTDAMVRVTSPVRSCPDLGFDTDGLMMYDIDSNIALSLSTQWMKRAIALASIENRVARRESASKYFEDLVDLAESRSKRMKALETVLFRKARSEALSLYYLLMLAPAVEAMCVAEDTSIAHHHLTLLACDLRLHQLETGEYPESLDDLSLEEGEALPLDPFTNEPFRYERRGDGFLLYSLGANGQDDGGSDAQGEFVDGDYAPIDWLGERPKPDGPDDVVVRLPIPALETPVFSAN